MIRYSSYGSTNYRTNPGAPTKLLCSLPIEYRELQDLREQIRMAEAHKVINRPRAKTDRIVFAPFSLPTERLANELTAGLDTTL